MAEKRYTIGGREYTQPPLVLGQLQQILDLVEGVAVPADGSSLAIVRALGGKLPMAMAIVLVADGVDIATREMEADELWLRDHMDLFTAVEVAEDFFAVNRVSLLLERAGRIRAKSAPAAASPTSPSPSPEGTSPNGNGPCGA